jgi:hypothetical protein
MDSVRFGRALGVGARAAAKTLVSAVDAATAPNPSAATGSGEAGSTQSTAANLGRKAARTTEQVRQTGKGLKRGSKRFGEAVWGPFVKLSGVLWLEFTGVFFGIFALFAGLAVWRLREAWRLTATNAATHRSFEGAVVMLAVFGYFCVSSFVRARRRERRR